MLECFQVTLKQLPYFVLILMTLFFFYVVLVISEPLDSLGDSISTGVVISWSKQPGDVVKEDDVVAIIETDKVSMDIRAKRSGVFVAGAAPAGSEVSFTTLSLLRTGISLSS